MNPFKSRWPIEDRSEWIGSQKVFEDLESNINQKVNTYILGPQGSGKTALLNCFFTFSYRKEMAREHRILIYSADLSSRKNGEDICNYLADQLKNALKRLLRGSAQLEEILEGLREIESDSSETRLQQTIAFLHEEYRYFVVLVMDNFELFTSSPSITMEHHEKLRSLIESRMLQCIVATNYDLSKDSLPADVKGSYLLQKFTDPILLQPFSEEKAKEFVEKKQEKSSLKLSENVITVLYRLSGGIPWLLAAAAQCAYDSMAANDGHMHVKATKEALYQACRPIMEGWCKLLTSQQVEVLKRLSMQPGEKKELACYDFTGEMELLEAVSSLAKRGIVQRAFYQDQFGNLRNGSDYYVSLNSLLFQRFCREGRMEETAKRNPLFQAHSTKEHALTDGRERMEGSSLAGGNTAGKGMPSQGINIYLGEGAKLNMPGVTDNSQTIQAEQVQIQQGIHPSQLLELLRTPGDFRQLFASRLSEQIQKKLPGGGIQPILLPEGSSEEEIAQQYDLEYNRVSQQIIQDVEVDEEQDLVGVTAEDLQTLDDRFREARARCRGNLSDVVLEAQSERCQFYIKLSVVVEDALNFPGAFSMDDFSPQLVLYGKALEQALRDNLYELFHKETKLSIYDTYAHSENGASSKAFKNMTERDTYIGNYAYLIHEKKAYLDELCRNHSSCTSAFPVSEPWLQWWHQLQLDIHSARKIRNLTDHADEASPDQTNLDLMCELLFGGEEQKGILERIGIGKVLARQLFPPSISEEAVEDLVGNLCQMRCTQLKSNGGIKGRTCEGGYVVNISPRKANRYRNTHVGMEFQEGQIFMVKILERGMQNEVEFFHAEFAEEN